jgi:long-chain acyl-CoA synthetase
MGELKPWLDSYPSGIPVNIDPSKYPTLMDFANECFTKFKNKVAFSNFDKTITYGQIDKYSTQFAAYLQSRGLNPGDKIAIMMPNLLQYPIAIFGALKAGLIIVNTNPMYTPREMKHQFTDSDCKAIVIVENFASNLEKIIGETSINTVIITSIGEMLGAVKGTIVNFMVRTVKRMVPKFKINNTVPFKEALKQGSKFKINAFESKPDDVILHQYTGGTTGISKGAMLTNQNMIANMLQIKYWIGGDLEEGSETVISPLPMYHIFAFSVNCLAMMGIGAKTILVTNARDLPSVVKEFKKHPISVMTGINTLFNALMNREDFKACDFSNLKVTVGGGMAVQRAIAEEWERVTGCQLTEGYGMTEASPVVCVNPIQKGKARIGYVGLPVSGTTVQIADDSDKALAIGEVGEIQVKGHQVMKGYYNRPDETVKTVRNGWLCTGDIGMMDADGFVKIVDRKKDMILVSGFNVFPNEIEDVVATHPKVLEVAAIGIPDDKSGEVVKIFVVKKDNSLTEEEIIQHCRQGLTGYKIPKAIEWRDELPKSNVGKILRRKLKEKA